MSNIQTLCENYFLILSILLSNELLFIKFVNINIKSKYFNIIFAITFILPIVIVFAREYNFIYSQLLLLVLSCIINIKLINKSYGSAIIITIICIGFSFCIQIINTLIISCLIWNFSFQFKDFISLTLIIILQFVTVFFISKIKRLSRGLLFLSNNYFGLGLIISAFIIVIICISGQNFVTKEVLSVLMLGTFISAVGLFFWIRKSITEHYRKKLQTKAEEHYQNTLAEKERYIEQLTNSNNYLSKVVHRDNHLMSSLQYSIEQFKNCNDEKEKDKILNEILTLANERGDLLLKEQKSNKLLAGTGSPIIDGALGNMYVKAAAHNIDFNLVVNEEVHYLINNIILQTDLETLLCDHIKDAIIAIEADDNIAGKILVTIEMVDNIYEISIKDNGVDFDVDTLAKLGLERVTTHKDSGGSGIGFMTTFETLEKTNGSLIIIEYENKIPFSKSIIFRFDSLNSFIIKSYRSDELKEHINRDDMIIL